MKLILENNFFFLLTYSRAIYFHFFIGDITNFIF